MAQLMTYKIQNPRSVMGDICTNWKWITAFLVAAVAYTCISAALFLLVEARQIENLNYARSIYFTVINITTVGFGDISPKTTWGMAIAGVNSVVGLVLFGFIVASFTAALQSSSTEFAIKPVGAPDNRSDMVEQEPKDFEQSESTASDRLETPNEKVIRFIDALTGVIKMDDDIDESAENVKRTFLKGYNIQISLAENNELGSMDIAIRTNIGVRKIDTEVKSS